MINIIQDLYKFGANLTGEGFYNALGYINKIIPLELITIPFNTKLETWSIPEEWVVKDAWVKFNGEKILDYQKDPLCLMSHSIPFQGKLTKEELKKHLFTNEKRKKSYEWNYNFYKRDWAFSIPFEKINEHFLNKETQRVEVKDIMPEGEYEVFIDVEFKQTPLRIGVHTIRGKIDREILLFAHLDHPYQANDNLSGVACLIDLWGQLKDKFNHTIKIIFCPETIGSIAYALTQDLTKVDYMMAIDAIGNDNTLLIQKSFDKDEKLNLWAHLSLHTQGISYRKTDFRLETGSDEYIFNDPKVRIPGIMVTRIPYEEYHTSDDTPDKINEDKIKEVQKFILKTIEISENDPIPKRNFSGPLMRSKFGLQTDNKFVNLDMDYLWYDCDGKKTVGELCSGLGISYDYSLKFFSKLSEHGIISWVNNSQGKLKKTSRKKQTTF